MSSNNVKELKRNTIIIAISNFGSKAISFVLAPLYSYHLTTEQYGKMDLITTTASLLLPLLCLDIYEASFRFSSEETDNSKVLNTTLFVCFIELLLVFVVFAPLTVFSNISPIITVCFASALLDSFFYVLSQYERGRGKMKVFAFSGILNSIVLLLMNILTLVLLKQELQGWIISFLVAKIVAIIYLFLRDGLYKKIAFKYFDKFFFKEALKYCLPLMPSTAMWWVMNASDRYMISGFVSIAATGIYAVGNKLPTLLSVFENVFYQAWQTTAINSKNDEKRDELYSSVFEKYAVILSVGVILILAFLKLAIEILFADEYHSAWICSGVLVVAVLFHALGGNLGSVYTVFKDTKGALKTSAIGATVNIVLNFFFIPAGGILAASITTLIGYITVLLYRIADTKKFVRLRFNINKLGMLFALVTGQIILYYFDGCVFFAARCVIAGLSVFVFRKELLAVLKR